LPKSLTPDQLHTLARYGAQARLEEIRTEIVALQDLVGEAPARRTGRKAVSKRGRRKRGKLSAQGRANIIAAQKARWAKIKSEKSVTTADTAPTTQRATAAQLSADNVVRMIADHDCRNRPDISRPASF